MSTVRIRYNVPNLRGLGHFFTLRPGENDVPAEVWQQFEDHFEFVALVKSGDIEVLGQDGTDDDEAPQKRAPRAKAPKAPKAPKADDDDEQSADAELRAQLNAALGGE